VSCPKWGYTFSAMKCAVVVAVLFCLCAIDVTSQPDKAHTKREQSAEPKSPPSLPTPNSNVTAYHAEESKGDPPKWYAPLERPDWWLVLIALLTGGAVAYQAREMRAATDVMRGQLTAMQGQLGQMDSSGKQTDKMIEAAQKSADAAKISSDIAARVAVPTLVIESFEVGETGAANLAAFLQYPRINIVIKNCGQTPAFLKWWTIIFTTEDLPCIPMYNGKPGCGIILDKLVVEPNSSYLLPELLFPHRQQLDIGDVQAVIDHQKEFNAYGYICYGDLFGNPLKRLKFCETALNLFDSPPFINWADFGLDGYTGTDQFPARKASGQGVEGQPSPSNAKTEDDPEKAN
jgi:hypothetical protein